nr:capsid protein precursor [Caprine astrovirus]URG87093.1 capsid protein precursor [Caprine astrovirus]
MASRRNARAVRSTTNIVVRNGTTAQAGRPMRQQQVQQQATRTRRRRRRTNQVNVRVLPTTVPTRRAAPRRAPQGNRVVVQKIVTTLGTVGSNGSGNIETELAVLLNPCTMKEATGSNSFGPLQIYASTYSLFSMRSLRLHLKPLVGSSAVSGTAVRMSWNPTNNPTQVSWSSLGARKHSDTTPGKDGRFFLSARDLKGPKDGWYKTNTKGDPMLSFAGSLEVHTLGETRSTYQNGQFTGGLFLAELETVWAFKDYSQQPGLMNLVKGDSPGDAKITTDETGRVILKTATSTALARAAATTSAAEIIWMVTDAIITAGASAFPAPFSWLLRGGWWFLKRIAGAPIRAGEETFVVYSSINDARADVPCIADTANAQEVNIGQLHFQQITPGNTGISTDIPQSRVVYDQFYGFDTVFTPTTVERLKYGSTNEMIPGYLDWYYLNTGMQNPTTGIAFKADGVTRATYNLYKVAFSDPPDVDTFRHKIPIYMVTTNNTQGALVGVAVAKSFSRFTSNTTWRVDNFLVYATTTEGANYDQQWRVTSVNYPRGSWQIEMSTVTKSSSGTVRLQLQAGSWYVIQFPCYAPAGGPAVREYVCGGEVVGTESNQTINIGTQQYPGNLLEGDNSMAPLYACGFALTPFRAGEIDVRQTLAHNLDEQEVGAAIEGLELDDSDDLEMAPGDHYSDPPMSVLVVRPEAQDIYDMLVQTSTDRAARLAVNQIHPSDEYIRFGEMYHDALADGLSPPSARAYALGLDV